MTGDLSELSIPEVRAAGWPAGGDMAWDVGANTGMTLPVLTALYTRVLAFEPAVESFERMKHDWGSKTYVRLMNWAVADHDGTLPLAVRAGPIQSGQLVAPGMRWEWGPDMGVRNVPCVTLDRLAHVHGIPDFVKIDTEGGELLALQGAARLLAERQTDWLVEFHSVYLHGACEVIFAAAGYHVETTRSGRFAEGSDDWLAYGWMKAVPHADH